MKNIFTFSEVQSMLGLRYPQSVRDLVEQIGLTAKPVPYNGNARGLDTEDVRLLRERLSRFEVTTGATSVSEDACMTG
jgi:RNase P/RNase MRP subunit p30